MAVSESLLAKTHETQKLAELLNETLRTVQHEIAALEAMPTTRIASYIRQTEKKLEINSQRLQARLSPLSLTVSPAPTLPCCCLPLLCRCRVPIHSRSCIHCCGAKLVLAQSMHFWPRPCTFVSLSCPATPPLGSHIISIVRPCPYLRRCCEHRNDTSTPGHCAHCGTHLIAVMWS